MREYLTAALVAPLAAHGSVAVGNFRPSWDRPGRSALLGLIGACLGIERDDEDGQGALRGYCTAVMTVAAGVPMSDWHTAQAPRGTGRWQTRGEELAAVRPSDDPVTTRREYRQDAAHLFVVWPRGDARWSLEEVAAAMRAPVYPPCAGRRSCVLALPLGPSVVQAADPVDALVGRYRTGPEAAWRARWRTRQSETLIAYLDEADAPSGAVRRVVTRRDDPSPRGRGFYLRREAVIEIPRPEMPSRAGRLTMENVL